MTAKISAEASVASTSASTGDPARQNRDSAPRGSILNKRRA